MLRKLCFRSHAFPSRPLPLNVRSAGHYELPPGEAETREPGEFCQFFWACSGGGWLEIGKRRHRFGTGQVFHYLPGEAHRIVAGRSGLSYRWLTLDGPEAAAVPGRFYLTRIRRAGPCPEECFEELPGCLRDATLAGERRASVWAYEILLAASCGLAGTNAPADNRTARRARQWIDRHHPDPHLNISGLADRLGVHRSTLYRSFKKQFGVSLIQYLNRLRIRRALRLLQETRLPIADVAVQSGIPDIAYFSRQIRSQTGFGPRAFRQRVTRSRPGTSAAPSKTRGRRFS